MSTRTITIEELATLSREGRVAARLSSTFGQTAAGEHAAVSAERLVRLEVSPTGVGYDPTSNLNIYAAREAGEGRVFFDPDTGRAWWGSSYTLRVLPEAGASLERGSIQKDAANAAYQKAMLSGAA